MTVACKNYLASQKKYLKKVIVETPWTQPVLTSNGTLGGNSFAVQATSENYGGVISPAYQAFTNDTTLRYYSKSWAASGNQSIIFYNPIAIKLTQLNLYIGTNNGYFGITAGTIFASNDNQSWTQLKTFTAQDGSTSSVINNTINLSSNTGFYKYYKITATSSSTHGSGLACVKITATEQTWQECTKQEYDLLPDSDRMLDSSNRRTENRYMANVGKKYLKKVTVEMPWTQPILSANGTLGGDSFAVYTTSTAIDMPQNLYKAFNSTDNPAGVTYARINTNDVIFYSPNPLKCNQFSIMDYWSGSYYQYGLRAGIVKGSNNGTDWVTIANISGGTAQKKNVFNFTNNNFYKYYMLTPTDVAPEGWYCQSFRITNNPTQQVSQWQECTKEEYDQLPDDQKHIENVNYIC